MFSASKRVAILLAAFRLGAAFIPPNVRSQPRQSVPHQSFSAVNGPFGANVPETSQVIGEQREATKTKRPKISTAWHLEHGFPLSSRRSWLLTTCNAASCLFVIKSDVLAKTHPSQLTLTPPKLPPTAPSPKLQSPAPSPPPAQLLTPASSPPSSELSSPVPPPPTAKVSSPAPAPAPPSSQLPSPVPSQPPSKPIQAVRVRRPVAFGLLELTISDSDGYEQLVLPASIVDRAPPAIQSFLKKVNVRGRRLSTNELFIAGFLAGVAAEVAKVTILHPLDTVKTRLQSSALQGRGSPTNITKIASLFAEPFAGLAPALASAAPQAGVFFGTRDIVRRNLNVLVEAGQMDGTVAALVALAIASSAYWAVRAPTEVLKLEQQAAIFTKTDADDRMDWLSLGLRALPTCILTDLPTCLPRVLAYKAIKEQWISANPTTDVLLLSDEVQLAVGIACLFAVLTTPLDVLRTRTLRRLVRDSAAESASDPTSLIAAIRELRDDCARNGGGVLFAGALPRFFWNGVCVGATTPLKSIGFYWVRDGVILELFDRASKAATLG